jgi:tetratricopeptide (TPR) repeat protein
VNLALRGTLAIAAGAVAMALGWCTIHATRADALAQVDPQAALRLDPAHPQALLRAAIRQLRDGENVTAIATARRLLSIEPAQGEAFAVVARAAIARGDDNAASLLSIAARRAPSDSAIRGQSAAAELRAGDLTSAMHQIDALLRLSAATPQIYQGMATQAEDPKFAEALADTLATEPGWRHGFMSYLGAKGTPRAFDRVNAALLRRGELNSDESERWLDRMFRDGRWGQAYAYWIGMLKPMPPSLPLAYNGGFEELPSNIGFDWHKVRVPGVATELGLDAGASGTKAAHFRFLGLRAAGGDMRLPLLLAPGRYRLAVRARAEYLRSDQGLHWKIRCANGQEIAATEPLADSFQWRQIQVEFEVPATQCPGQWLALENPAIAGPAQQVSGDLWTDDIRVIPLHTR